MLHRNKNKFSPLISAQLRELSRDLEFSAYSATLLWLSHPDTRIVNSWAGEVRPSTRKPGLTLIQSVQVDVYLTFLEQLNRGEGDFFFDGPYMIVRAEGTEYTNGAIGVSRGGSQPEFFGAVFWAVVREIERNGKSIEKISTVELAAMAMTAQSALLN
jgi:hypothetical protein